MSLELVRRLATAAAVTMLLASCGSEESAPKPESDQPDANPIPVNPSAAAPRNKIVQKTTPDGKRMDLSATDPEGKHFTASIGDKVEIPDEFPKDVPIYPESTPMAFLYAPGEGIIVTFKSRKEQQEIFDFYHSRLPDAGWEILEGEVNDSGKLSFEAVKDTRKATVNVAGTEGDARISVMVTPENSSQ